MNEEFENGLTQSAKLKICDELRECCVDILVIREKFQEIINQYNLPCLLYTSPSPRDNRVSRMPSSA